MISDKPQILYFFSSIFMGIFASFAVKSRTYNAYEKIFINLFIAGLLMVLSTAVMTPIEFTLMLIEFNPAYEIWIFTAAFALQIAVLANFYALINLKVYEEQGVKKYGTHLVIYLLGSASSFLLITLAVTYLNASF